MSASMSETFKSRPTPHEGPLNVLRLSQGGANSMCPVRVFEQLCLLLAAEMQIQCVRNVALNNCACCWQPENREGASSARCI
eukprot:10770322-Alexandrium_andersonii.AAC.1